MIGARMLMAVAGIALLSLPSAALGADAYVDFETGTDDAACGPIAQPCQSIAYAVPKAGSGDTVRVDDRAGAYGSPLAAIILGAGKSLVGEEFAGGDENAEPEPDVIIDPFDPIGFSNSIWVQAGNPAGTIRDLRLRNDYGHPLVLDASATVTGNVFDEPDSPSSPATCWSTTRATTPRSGRTTRSSIPPRRPPPSTGSAPAAGPPLRSTATPSPT